MSSYPIIPIILAGGKGSRLWPLSRESFPKQFHKLIEEDKFSLLQRTFKRIESLENLTKPIIVCNEEHRFIVGDQMKEINTDPMEIILEPCGRNTAPAIAIASLTAIKYCQSKGKDPILLILSSDHNIKDEEAFRNSLKISVKEAANDKLIIFSKPSSIKEIEKYSEVNIEFF